MMVKIKRAFGLVLVTALLISVMAFSGQVSAADGDMPYNITVTFNGNAKTQRGLCWSTNTSVTGSTVQVVQKTGASPDWSNPMEFNGTSTTVTERVVHNVHKVLVTGLSPGTAYWYRVGDKAKGYWSEAGTLKTEPASVSKYTALLFADTQFTTQAESVYGITAQRRAFAAYPDAAFGLHVGDMVNSYSGEGYDQMKMALEGGKDFFMNYTYAPASGDNDGVEPLISNFVLNHYNFAPAASLPTTKGVDYSFDYGDVHYIVVNTNNSPWQQGFLSQAQKQWLLNDAKASNKKFKVMLMHVSIYDAGHQANSSADYIYPARTILTPVIDEAGIDLVFSGHDHAWCKSKALKGGQVATENKIETTINGEKYMTTVNVDGTIYLSVASSGFRNWNGQGSYKSLQGMIDYYAGGGSGAQSQSFVRIEVDGNKMGVVAYNQTYSSGKFNEVFRYAILKGEVEEPTTSSQDTSSEVSSQVTSSTSSHSSAASSQVSSTASSQVPSSTVSNEVSNTVSSETVSGEVSEDVSSGVVAGGDESSEASVVTSSTSSSAKAEGGLGNLVYVVVIAVVVIAAGATVLILKRLKKI